MDYSSSKEPSSARAWWTRETVAVVTGANRGIGLALAARLGEHGITVVLTARDAERGEAAAAALRARGLHVVFHRLDVADPASVQAFAAWLRDAIGGLDILVNNAAVSFNEIDTNSVEHAETVLRTNFYGAKMLTEALLPLFRRSPATSRILNISSQLGLLNVSAQMDIYNSC
jgi:carbonyl reductase 1